MGQYNPQIDLYIQKSAPFAQPILEHLRRLIHQACPMVEETLKWGMPSFQYMGILCGIAAFKQHCAFGFWKHKLLHDPHGILKEHGSEAMGNLGRISHIEQLPADTLIVAFIQQAMKLNEDGVKLPARTKAAAKNELTVPADLATALEKNKAAKQNFEAFSYSQQKDYVEWITEAKTEPTRHKRLLQTLEWLAGGKPRNWKYMSVKKPS